MKRPWLVFLVTVSAVLGDAKSNELTEAELLEQAIMGKADALQGKPLGKVDVHLDLYLTGITEVNEELGYLETTGWLSLQWTDERLAQPSSVLGRLRNGTKLFRVSPEHIWVPDIELYNQISTGYQVLNRDPKVVVSAVDGVATYVESFSARSRCYVTSDDTQECVMRFGSWTYNGNELDLVVRPDLLLTEFVPNAHWGVGLESKGHKNVMFYPCCPEPYVNVLYMIKLQRRPRSWWRW